MILQIWGEKESKFSVAVSYPEKAPCGQGLRVSVLKLQMLLWLGRDVQKHTSTEELEELQ